MLGDDRAGEIAGTDVEVATDKNDNPFGGQSGRETSRHEATDREQTGIDVPELTDGEVQDEEAMLQLDVSPETAALAVQSAGSDDDSATVRTWLFNHVDADLAVTVDGEPLGKWRDGRDAGGDR